jgi:hypothetical protein
MRNPIGGLAAAIIIFLVIGTVACGSDEPTASNVTPTVPDTDGTGGAGDDNGGTVNTSLWTISEKEIRDGGPGKDGIPSIDNPQFNTDWNSHGYLRDHDLVVAVWPEQSSSPFVYPHPILDWHEVVNNSEGGASWSVSYCPLTGTAVTIDRERFAGTSFGVSGLLYRNNLIMYDRETDSNWAQIYMECVQGQWSGSMIEPLFYLETTVATAKKMFPSQVKILTTVTGNSAPYGSYPYGTYRTSTGLLFNMNVDGRLHPKARVLGVLTGPGRGSAARAYPINDAATGVEVINDEVGGVPLVVIRSGIDNFAVAFSRLHPQLGELTFEAATGAADIYPLNIRDQETGTLWNILGEALEGQLVGSSLDRPRAMTAYWFAWAGFYGQTDIYSP